MATSRGSHRSHSTLNANLNLLGAAEKELYGHMTVFLQKLLANEPGYADDELETTASASHVAVDERREINVFADEKMATSPTPPSASAGGSPPSTRRSRILSLADDEDGGGRLSGGRLYGSGSSSQPYSYANAIAAFDSQALVSGRKAATDAMTIVLELHNACKELKKNSYRCRRRLYQILQSYAVYANDNVSVRNEVANYVQQVLEICFAWKAVDEEEEWARQNASSSPTLPSAPSSPTTRGSKGRGSDRGSGLEIFGSGIAFATKTVPSSFASMPSSPTSGRGGAKRNAFPTPTPTTSSVTVPMQSVSRSIGEIEALRKYLQANNVPISIELELCECYALEMLVDVGLPPSVCSSRFEGISTILWERRGRVVGTIIASKSVLTLLLKAINVGQLEFMLRLGMCVEPRSRARFYDRLIGEGGLGMLLQAARDGTQLSEVLSTLLAITVPCLEGGKVMAEGCDLVNGTGNSGSPDYSTTAAAAFDAGGLAEKRPSARPQRSSPPLTRGGARSLASPSPAPSSPSSPSLAKPPTSPSPSPSPSAASSKGSASKTVQCTAWTTNPQAIFDLLMLLANHLKRYITKTNTNTGLIRDPTLEGRMGEVLENIVCFSRSMAHVAVAAMDAMLDEVLCPFVPMLFPAIIMFLKRRDAIESEGMITEWLNGIAARMLAVTTQALGMHGHGCEAAVSGRRDTTVANQVRAGSATPRRGAGVQSDAVTTPPPSSTASTRIAQYSRHTAEGQRNVRTAIVAVAPYLSFVRTLLQETRWRFGINTLLVRSRAVCDVIIGQQRGGRQTLGTAMAFNVKSLVDPLIEEQRALLLSARNSAVKQSAAKRARSASSSPKRGGRKGGLRPDALDDSSPNGRDANDVLDAIASSPLQFTSAMMSPSAKTPPPNKGGGHSTERVFYSLSRTPNEASASPVAVVVPWNNRMAQRLFNRTPFIDRSLDDDEDES